MTATHSRRAPFRRIGIFTKRDEARVREPVQTLVERLRERDVDLVIDRHGAACLEHTRGLTVVDAGPAAAGRELIIVVGGDGALLRAARQYIEDDVRILGVNVGRLGFLTDLSPDQLDGRLDAILDGAFVEEPRYFLSCSAWRGERCLEASHALNDVVIEKWNTARLISFDTYLDGRLVHSLRSDGMIIATPTGSTAYALSAGGPILHPGLDALVMVPLSPHTLTHRPIVVSSDTGIEVIVTTREADVAHVTCDGDSITRLAPGDCVRVRRTERRVRLIHPADHDHYAVLRAKLHWGADLC